MAHFPVRHPFGASIATAMLFKIVPDDFVEAINGSNPDEYTRYKKALP